MDASIAARLLKEDSFENETFTQLDLRGAELAGKEFYRCVFEQSQLPETRWTEAKLEACAFRGCDLSSAKLKHTALRGVQFIGSKLLGVDWSAASTNPEVTFEECNLRYGVFSGMSLRKTSFARCSIVEATFNEVDLSDCDFTGSDLTSATLKRCVLSNTDFGGAVGLFVDPAQNRLKKTRVPIDAVVSLAETLGMIVPGFSSTKQRRG